MTGETLTEPALEPKPRKKRSLLKRVLVLAVVVLLVLGIYSYNRGLRYPPVQWDPRPMPVAFENDRASIECDGAYLIEEDADPPKFRAFVPEPVITVTWKDGAAETQRFMLENLHPEATVEGATDLGEGLLDRFLDVTATGATSTVRVKFPKRERYRFLAVGDTGGGEELMHCLHRAAELQTDFILFLGDIGYQEGELDGTGITHFGASPVPIYAAIGNHDFHGGFRYRFNTFKQYYGPLNSYFTLAGVEFLNLDTAADTVPPWGGRRGALLDRVREQREAAGANAAPLIAFTHRPLDDPRTFGHPKAEPHALNRRWEAEWLREELIDLGVQVLLAGHVHESHDFTEKGLRQIIAGEGLGDHKDPQILVGEFAPLKPAEFVWEPLR